MPDLTDYEYDIFLSHNHNDQDWTARLAERLEKENWQGAQAESLLLAMGHTPWAIHPQRN